MASAVISHSNAVSNPSPSPRKMSLILCWSLILGILGILLAIPYALGYGETRHPLAFDTAHFWTLDQWQHCWLVPLIIAFIVWWKRKTLTALPVAGHWSGLLPTVFGLFMYWAGYRTDNYFGGITSIWIVLAGCIIWFFGWQWMRALAFPWVFLFFAMPLLFLESMVAFRLRLIMSDASVALLNLLGIQCVQQGTAILSASNPMLNLPPGTAFSVDVADPCSGIRSLFALTMVTALYAYFTVKPLWKQWLLFACSIPLAIVGNMARIMMLTLGTIAMGSKIAIGSLENPSWFHMLAGFFVFIVALGGMIFIGTLLMTDWHGFWGVLRKAFLQFASAKRPAPAAPQRGQAPAQTEDTY